MSGPWTTALNKVRRLFNRDSDRSDRLPVVREQHRPPDGMRAVQPCDIFVSYASEDRAAVTALVSEIRSRGFSVWFDVEQFRGGQSFDILHEQIAQCSCFLAIISTAACASHWVSEETNAAIVMANEGRPITIMAVRLDPGVELPLRLKSRKAVDVFGSNWAGAIDFLTASLRGGSLPATPLERFRAFIEALPVVDDELASTLDSAHRFGNPTAWTGRWFGSVVPTDAERERVANQAVAHRSMVAARLESSSLGADAQAQILRAIDHAVRPAVLTAGRKLEVVSWLRRADDELLALASWLFDIAAERAVRGGRVLDLVTLWARMESIRPRDERALHLYGKGLLRRAVDSGLLVPRELDEDAGRDPSDANRWFDLELYEVCRTAYFFDVHGHDPELNKNPPFRPGLLHQA